MKNFEFNSTGYRMVTPETEVGKRIFSRKYSDIYSKTLESTSCMRTPNFENAKVNAAANNYAMLKSNRVQSAIKVADVIPETLVARIADRV